MIEFSNIEVPYGLILIFYFYIDDTIISHQIQNYITPFGET